MSTAPSAARPALSPRPRPDPWHDLPRTRTGQVKRRTTWLEKLKILDPTATPEETKARLQAFAHLFAFRTQDGIITKPGQGHRAWTKNQHPIYLDHVVRHLLGARLPGLAPQWIGARGCKHSVFFNIDIDANRTPEQILASDYDLTHADADQRAAILRDVLRNYRPKPPFALRCQQVDEALARLGIDAHNPAHVLVVPSPSGGRHVYVFFDRPYRLLEYQHLLEQAGLNFKKGEIEFFPSTSHGLRLPFGHLPNGPNDPRAWLRFVDAYQARRIKRHHLQHLYDVNRQQMEARHGRISSTTPTPAQQRGASHKLGSRHASQFGIPRRYRQENALQQLPAQQALARYDELLNRGPKSLAEADELLALGIRRPGTRTETLKHLAAHLVWFRQLSADDAITTLTTWALDPRHDSKDIRDDLADGTIIVTDHIDRMCRWYADHQDNSRRPDPNRPAATTHFATQELAAFRPHVQSLPTDQRLPQAEFLLHFLAFAKQHGRRAPDRRGFDAAPAVNAVIKKWPGCHHSNYQTRIEAAVTSGVLTLVKGKWQNPHGPGRARTYRLSVPIVDQRYWTMNYQSAVAFLTATDPATPEDSSITATATSSTSATPESSATVPVAGRDEPRDQGRPNDEPTANLSPDDAQPGDYGDRQGHSGTRTSRDHPTNLRETGPGVGLDPGPRERLAKPPPPPRLPGQNHGRLRPHPAWDNLSFDEYMMLERRRLQLTSNATVRRAVSAPTWNQTAGVEPNRLSEDSDKSTG